MNLELEKVAMLNKYAIVALTPTGKATALKLRDKLNRGCLVYTTEKLSNDQTTALVGSPVKAIANLFQEVDVLICIMATGIVIRSIAPVVNDKASDPAVIVLDEKATNVISLLSGHLGGANDLTVEIARHLDSNPVITTATDVQEVAALDNLAKSVNGWRDELRPLIKPFNALLANRETVYFYQEKEWVTDKQGLTVIKKEELDTILNSQKPLIALLTKEIALERPNLALIYPKPYVLGVGARKDVASDVFNDGFNEFCQMQSIAPSEISHIVSIDVKKEESAIKALSERLQCPFYTYTKEELQTVDYKYPQSAFVKKTVGVGSVAQASADYASNGQVISDRFAKNGCTYALGLVNVKK